jgi:hypothetical protein
MLDSLYVSSGMGLITRWVSNIYGLTTFKLIIYPTLLPKNYFTFI